MSPFLMLESLPKGYRAVVFGASGGLGTGFVKALSADARCAIVYAGSRGALSRDAAVLPPKVCVFEFDLEDEASIAAAAGACATGGELHLIVVATGVLHDDTLRPEKTWRAISPEALQKAFVINAVGPALIAKHMLGHLTGSQRSLFAVLSARVSSISDNRLGGWHAYRASKAALNMLIANFAIELRRTKPAAVCVALHPGTVDTALSRPFQANVPDGGLFSADQSVAKLLRVLDTVGSDHSGKLLAWDGSIIPG